MTEELKYKHTYDAFDILAEVIALLLLIGNAVLLVFSLKLLPDVIPNHFDMNGHPNGYGSKYTVCGPFIFNVVLYLLLTILSRFPQVYKSRMTKTNKVEEYRLATKMIISLKPILVAVFLVITYFMIQTAQLKLTDYLKFLAGGIILIVFSHVIYWVIRYSKLN